jgi:hypothetical protein
LLDGRPVGSGSAIHGKRFPVAIMQKVRKTRRTRRYFLHDREPEMPTVRGKALSKIGDSGSPQVRTEWHIQAT